MSLSRMAALVAALMIPACAVADPPAGWKLKHADKGMWVTGTATVDAKDPTKLSVKEGGTEVINLKPSSDLISEEKFGDCTVEVEFMIPKGSNSGVYLMGEYELQIYDTYEKKGKDPKPGDMAGIYTFAPPKVYVDKPYGEWQKFVIEFQAPKFEGGKKVSNAKFVKVTFNGTVIHENVECNKVTPGGLTGKEMAEGPLMFQGDHGQVAFKNIKVTAKK
ncbi:MAG TPA: DUF1080 domain-containing protein [Gemmataceae bacterium]|nr:DUF1080 domain-containing protein [Gemmataceae bacterium]